MAAAASRTPRSSRRGRSARRRSTTLTASAATRTRTSRSATRSSSARRLVVDLRYGVSRINTKNLAGNKEGFNDYACLRRAVEPAAADPVSRRGAERQPERLRRRQRRRQQLVGADDRQFQHQARIPDQPQRDRQRHEGARQVDTQGRRGVPQPAVELLPIPSRARSRCRRRSRTPAATSTSSTRRPAAAWRR